MKWSEYEVGDKDPGGEYQIIGIVLGRVAIEWFEDFIDSDEFELADVDLDECRVFLIQDLQSGEIYGALET